jgi:LAO/AO transport system kinase
LKNPSEDIDTLISSIKSGDRKSLARAITMVENDMNGFADLLKNLSPGQAPVIGFTGQHGAGKSTLINSFLRQIISLNKKAAVVAVDPTSPFNFGSLLADRLRMSEHFNNENIFIRSIATRGSLGGLSDKIIEITDVLRSADFDFVIVETVGVGQSEVEIVGLADTTIVVVVPESGDEIQAMKSGIMEIADIFVVNKSDREGAEGLVNNLKKMLSQRANSKWNVPVVSTIATSGEGIPGLLNEISQHQKSAGYNDKKIYLLTEKAYQLIRNFRMQGLQREDIKQKLDKSIKERDFNFYRFVNQFKN